MLQELSSVKLKYTYSDELKEETNEKKIEARGKKENNVEALKG